MKFSPLALVFVAFLGTAFSADMEVDPSGAVRNLGSSKSSKATPSPTASPTASPTKAPTGSPTAAPPTDPPTALLEESFLSGRVSDATTAQNDEGPQLIIGGTDAAEGEYPYYVYIGNCGGSLIAPRTVLTAAHCNVDANDDFTTDLTFIGKEVTVGAVQNPDLVADANDGSVKAIVENQVIHPDYIEVNDSSGNLEGLVNDFMLLYLDREVEIDNPNDIYLVLRDEESDLEPGTIYSQMGLGATVPGNPVSGTPTVLQEINNLVSVNDVFCNQIFPDVSTCAGSPQGDDLESSCRGDSGGPLVRKEGNIHYQVGVVSYGPSTCDGSTLAVYSQIPDNEAGFQFIQEITCSEFEDFGTFCVCESDCDCFDGGECVCEEQEIPEELQERRFLEVMEGEYKFALDDKTVRDNKAENEKERFNFHRSKNRRERRNRRLSSKSGSSSGKGGKSCKSVKCNKSSKSSSNDDTVGVCR